jgi:hypothetical protein
MQTQEAFVEDFDKRLDVALKKAAVEATVNEWPDLSDALDELRSYTNQWRGHAIERMKDLGIYSMTPEQYALWLGIMSETLAEKAVQEARAKRSQERSEWWQFWQIKVAVVASVASLLTVAVGSLYGLFFGGTHSLFYTVLHH